MASSGGRVLYRECGPSQDRNPVPGDLPFCFVFFFFFFVISFSIYFFEASLLFIFYTSLKRSVEYLCIVLFSLYYIGQGFLPLVGKFTLSKCTLKLRTCIETLLNLSIIISNNQVFLLMLLQSQNNQFFTQSLCTCSWQYVFHLLHIIFKFSFHAEQVPRSLVDRVLYREYGPYQDRYPVPVDLPFCFFSSFSITFLRNFAAIPILYQPKKEFGTSLYTPHNALLH